MEKIKVSERFRSAALKSNLKEIRRMMWTYESKDYGKELTWAVANGLDNVVRCLVEEYANIEYSNGLPLYIAVKRNHFSIVKYLVSEYAIVKSKRNPINEAIMQGNKKMIKFLTESAAEQESSIL